jgi:ankyrin repeat protein
MRWLLVIACQSSLNQQLIDAAAEGHTRKVEELLNNGVNIEVHARDDWTALTIAAREGHYETVRLLLDRGAKVNAKEGGGHTPLFWAKKYDRQKVAELLKEAGGRDE